MSVKVGFEQINGGHGNDAGGRVAVEEGESQIMNGLTHQVQEFRLPYRASKKIVGNTQGERCDYFCASRKKSLWLWSRRCTGGDRGGGLERR